MLVLALIVYVVVGARSPNLRSTWLKVLRDAPALCSSLILALFLL